MSWAVLVFGVPALIAMNAFFVAAEYGLVRSRVDRVETMRQEGLPGAELAKRQIDRIDEYIAACQVGITMASIGIGAIGEPTLARLLDRPLGSVLSHAAAVAIAGVVGYAVVTVLHILFGELVPKIFVVAHAEGVLRRIARPLQLSATIFRPLSSALSAAAAVVLRPFGIRADLVGEESAAPEDVKMLIARGMQGGTLDPGEAVMLSGVFHLHEQEARQVMTPIPAVVTVDVSEDVRTALERCVESGHTRLVVTDDGSTDRIRGIVHSNSLVKLLMRDGPGASIEGSIKDVQIIPETKPIDDLLADLQRERMSMAVVVDEYGRTVGIVSIEDIIEEIVGEIADETDPAGGAVRRLANGDWYVRGHVPITDLDAYGMHLPADSDAYNSVGGYVFAELGRLPKRGDMVRANGYSLRVESVRENRVEGIRIRDHEPERERDPLVERERPPADSNGRGEAERRESVREGG